MLIRDLFGRCAIAGLVLATATGAIAALPEGMTLDAFQATARHRMMQADADGDGKISKAEWLAARGAGKKADGEAKRDPGMMFDRLDKNGDGYLDVSEIDALTTRRFERLDANHDGVVTTEERAAMRAGKAAD